ncbi:MAG: hypothetical protein JRN59_06645 [Nitrososphaerota archaeon]|nr:hypothetical protein [Nitrososphaerota archaeon]
MRGVRGVRVKIAVGSSIGPYPDTPPGWPGGSHPGDSITRAGWPTLPAGRQAGGLHQTIMRRSDAGLG